MFLTSMLIPMLIKPTFDTQDEAEVQANTTKQFNEAILLNTAIESQHKNTDLKDEFKNYMVTKPSTLNTIEEFSNISDRGIILNTLDKLERLAKEYLTTDKSNKALINEQYDRLNNLDKSIHEQIVEGTSNGSYSNALVLLKVLEESMEATLGAYI